MDSGYRLSDTRVDEVEFGCARTIDGVDRCDRCFSREGQVL